MTNPLKIKGSSRMANFKERLQSLTRLSMKGVDRGSSKKLGAGLRPGKARKMTD